MPISTSNVSPSCYKRCNGIDFMPVLCFEMQFFNVRHAILFAEIVAAALSLLRVARHLCLDFKIKLA